MIRSASIRDKHDLVEGFGWKGVLAAVRRGVNSTVHTTLRATPTQLVFGRDAVLNINFHADWEYIRQRKQKLIIQNNSRENEKRKPHDYVVGDQVMIREDPNRKHGQDLYLGPYTVSAVYDNGTVQLQKAANNGGAVYMTWNIRNLDKVP